jgi:hypothetical protein
MRFRSLPRALAAALALAALALSVDALAQPRVEFRLGVAGVPVAGAWNPLTVVVRDAPGATLTLSVDAGGLERGEVPQRLDALVAPAGGVQRLELDLPLASWRRITWRVEQDGRVLGSGGLAARERDERPLDLLLSARPAAWDDRFGPDARTVSVAASDLPERPAGWDGVRSLLVDGTVAPPDPEVVVTAAVAGVDVYLPSEAPAGYAALTRLVDGGSRRLGAGSLAPLSALGSEELARAPTVGDARSALAAAVPPPTWDHRPAWLIAVAAGAFAVAVWTLVRLAGIAAWASAAMLWAAAWFAAPLVAPPDVQPQQGDALVVVAGGLGLRLEHRAVASAPAGTTWLDGTLARWEVGAVAWRDGRTRIETEAGGRARFDAPSRVVGVPDAVREASPGVAPAAPESLARLVPEGAALLRSGDAWWLVLDPVGAS